MLGSHKRQHRGQIASATLKVTRREKLKLGCESYNALVISEESDTGSKITRWQLDNGKLIKETISNIYMVLESKDQATKPAKPVNPNSDGKKRFHL